MTVFSQPSLSVYKTLAMSEPKQIVTIDGPAGVGKSTVSRLVAAAIGFLYLDTGAMYRAVGLFLVRKGVELENSAVLTAALSGLELELFFADGERGGNIGIRLNGEDVSEAIRTPAMAMVASRVSALSPVRTLLTAMQRDFGGKGGVVAEGRDTGTVVFPRAAHKFFLDARPEIRAARRVDQLALRGVAADYKEILAMTIERDRNDRERALAPLRPAADAHCLDTSDMSIAQVVGAILEKIQ
jgi:CMP/dCMP kinase